MGSHIPLGLCRLGDCSRDYHSPRDGVPSSLCTGTESSNAKDTAGSAKAGSSFSMFCPSILQGKGPLSPRAWEEPGSGFVTATEESPLSSQRPMFLIRGPGIEGGAHLYMYI